MVRKTSGLSTTVLPQPGKRDACRFGILLDVYRAHPFNFVADVLEIATTRPKLVSHSLRECKRCASHGAGRSYD